MQVCSVLGNLASNARPTDYQHSARREGAKAGKESARDSAEDACRVAIRQAVKAAQDTLDAKALEWLRKGGGNSSKLLHGQDVPRVPLKIHEEQLSQMSAAVCLRVGRLGEEKDVAEEKDSTVSWIAGPADLRGQQYIQLPQAGVPPMLVFHLQRKCYLYVLRDTELKDRPRWLTAGAGGVRFNEKEGMLVEVEWGKGDRKEKRQLAVYKSTLEQEPGCVVLGSASSAMPVGGLQGETGEDEEEAGLDGCVVVVSYTDGDDAEAVEVQSDAQMLLQLWFTDKEGGPEQSETYGKYWCRRQSPDELPPLDKHFLPTHIANKLSQALGGAAGPVTSSSGVGWGVGGGAPEQGAKGDEYWDWRVSASVRRFVAIAQLIDAYENLNRAECSLEAVSMTHAYTHIHARWKLEV